MSLAYFPMFPSDFDADTMHLTLAEDGAYNRLLRLCWRTPGCSVPADSAWIYRRMRANTYDDKAAIDAVLGDYFEQKNGRYFSPRLSKEWASASAAYEKRKTAGKKGGSSKSLKNNNISPSNAKAMLKQPEPEPKSELCSEKKKNTKRKNPDEKSAIEHLGDVLSLEASKAVVEHRRNMRKPLTAYAAKLLAARFAKASQQFNSPPDDFANLMIERGWQGFDAEWVRPPPIPPKPQRQSTARTLSEAFAEGMEQHDRDANQAGNNQALHGTVIDLKPALSIN